MQFKKSGENKTDLKKDYKKSVLLSLSDLSKYPGHVLQTVTIPPHTKQRKHLHHKQTEIGYVLSGHAIYYINDIPHEMTKGDVIIDEPGESHYILNSSEEDFVILISKISMPTDSDDTTWLEE